MFDPPKPSIAVGFVTDSQGRLLLTWNNKWQCFTIPMTKIDTEPPAETVAQAAVRAVSEVLGVPTRAVPGKAKEIGVMRHCSSPNGTTRSRIINTRSHK